MTTPRQELINTVAFKVSERNYETWRYEQGDPTENGNKNKILCDAMGCEYHPMAVDEATLNEIVEGALTRTTRKYYLDLSDEGYKRLAATIQKEAKKRTERLIDTYQAQQEVKRQREKTVDEIDVFEAMKAIITAGYDRRVSLSCNGNEWRVEFWNRTSAPGVVAKQCLVYGKTPQEAVLEAVRQNETA